MRLILIIILLNINKVLSIQHVFNIKIINQIFFILGF